MFDASLGKAELRRLALSLRNDLDPCERSKVDQGIIEQVMAFPGYQDCQLLLAYSSFGSEVDTFGLMRHAWDGGKRVALPCSNRDDHTLIWREVLGEHQLVPGAYGILEPDAEECGPVDPHYVSGVVCLVPGLIFNRQGFRVGYGGGYYDRFLEGFAQTSLGLCRSAFLVDHALPLDPCDIPVNFIVTEDCCLYTM